MRRLLFPTVLALTFALGLGIRLYDLTDPPFDFHATRQWRSAVIARGMYYGALPTAPEPERSIAVDQWRREALIEPPLLEWAVSRLYLIAGGEYLWIARLLSSVFWVTGGAAVFLLAQALVSGSDSGRQNASWTAWTSLAYFLFLPYGMIASRSFQPDPLMVALLAASAWRLHAWGRDRTRRNAILAGTFTGLAILAKAVAIFPLGAAAAALALSNRGLRSSLRDPQTWTVAALALLPLAAYYLNGLFLSGFLAGQGGMRFFPQMWSDPAFYIRWVEMATGITGLTVLAAGLAGIALAPDRTGRTLLAGLWIGYLLYGFALPFHTITHDYYTLPLIPITAVSIAPVSSVLLAEIGKRPHHRLAFAGAAALAAAVILFKVWDARVILARQDFRAEAGEWGRFKGVIPPGKSVVALAHAYGYPLAYYGWTTTDPWPTDADTALRSLSGQTEEQLEAKQLGMLADHDFFLITNFNELDRQPELKAALASRFPVYLEGEGFLIYALRP